MVAVREGQSRSLLVVGPAGIGKSWLCRQASVLAEGFTVVPNARRRERGPSRLRRPVRCALAAAGRTRGSVARTAPGRAAGRVEDRRGARPWIRSPWRSPPWISWRWRPRTCPCWSWSTTRRGWTRPASKRSGSAARRLDADRVGFLFAARERVGGAVCRRGVAAGRRPGHRRGRRGWSTSSRARRVAASVARTLAEAGRGDPLWLREAARELSPEQMSGAAPLTDRFRAPASVRETVRAARAESSRPGPASARRARGRRAGAGAGDAAGARPISGSTRALQAGIDCGLAHMEAGRPRFSHPLALAAALEVADPAQRRLAHEALARAWDDAGESERATWHRAESGDGPDAHVSSALAAVARAARARGAPGAAAAAWQRAVETAPDADQALPLRLERARDLAQAGRASEALVELDEILDRGRRRGAARGRRRPAGPAADLAGPPRAGRSRAGRRAPRGSATAILRARR